MSESPEGEKRIFTRVTVTREATLAGAAGEQPVTVEDISLNGVLVHLADEVPLATGDDYELSLPLGDDIVISMTLALAHQEGDRAGFRCRFVDLESVSHLRRIVEYNLGDPQLLHRELGELSQVH